MFKDCHIYDISHTQLDLAITSVSNAIILPGSGSSLSQSPSSMSSGSSSRTRALLASMKAKPTTQNANTATSLSFDKFVYVLRNLSASIASDARKKGHQGLSDVALQGHLLRNDLISSQWKDKFLSHLSSKFSLYDVLLREAQVHKHMCLILLIIPYSDICCDTAVDPTLDACASVGSTAVSLSSLYSMILTRKCRPALTRLTH